MFTTHTIHTKPKNSLQKLWRYLTLERLCQIIEEGSIYFSHITQMSDKWEGLLTKRTKEKLFNAEYNKYISDPYKYDKLKAAEAANGAIKQYEDWKNDYYINCWHMNDAESYLMWKVYGDKGCVIQSTYERVASSFGSEPPKIEGCVVEYIDYDKEDFAIGNVYTQIGYKSLPYIDEREYRLIFWKEGLENQKYIPDEKGIKIKVDTKMLINNIYLNPISAPSVNDLERLERLINEKGLDCEIKNSKILEKK